VSFKSVLEDIGRRLEGVLGVAVIGDDGIIVDRYAADPDFDSELASVEYVASCRELKRAGDSIESGALEEVTIASEKTTVLLRIISPGYFIILLMRPGQSLGRGRYEIKRASYQLAPEFL
jgi:predicted regulator of Ras-like GTPase activity (Roadblock/LC7/MglB family)